MPEDLDAVLRRVAAGELSPDEALARLDAARVVDPPVWGTAPPPPPAGGSLPEPPLAPEPPPAPEPPLAPGPTGASGQGGAVRVIRVNASYRSVHVLADASVDTAVALGPHSVRHDGDALVVESPQPAFLAETAEPGLGGAFSFASLPRSLAWARSFKDQHLVVRVNPALPLELDAAGASVRLSGLEGGVRLRLIASSAKTERLRGALDLDALTSSVKGSATLTGSSRVVCESSSVKLQLDPGTDVRVRVRNRMSKVALPTLVSKGGLVDPDICETVIGDGAGELSIDAVISSVMLESTSRVSPMAAGASR